MRAAGIHTVLEMTVMTSRSPAGCEQKEMSFDEGQTSATREAVGGTTFTTSAFLVFLVHSLWMGCWTKTTQRKTTTTTATIIEKKQKRGELEKKTHYGLMGRWPKKREWRKNE